MKQRELDEGKRINSLHEKQFLLKESELRETTAKLSVYQQIDNTLRFSSAVDDIEPELQKTKHLKQKNEQLERDIAILKQGNSSELS